MRTIYLKAGLIVSVLSLLLQSSLYAGAATGGATEPTQIMNYAQLFSQRLEMVKQTLEQVNIAKHSLNSYKNLVENTKVLPEHEWGDTSEQLQRLVKVIQQGRALAYSMSNIDQQYQARYKGYDYWLQKHGQIKKSDFQNRYRNWSDTTNDSIFSTLKAANLQASQFASEESTMRTLQTMSETAGGRMQALQVGNQIAAQQTRQLQKLRHLMMAQIQMQTAYLASATDMNASQKAFEENFYSNKNKTVIGDSKGYTWKDN